MPKGSVPKREAKKPKKKSNDKVIESLGIFASTEVEVVKKRRKVREEEVE